MPIGLIIAAGFLVGEYIYHWLTRPPPPPPATEITVPLTEVGTPVPLVYGRIRVEKPILAYISTPPPPQYRSDFASYEYFIDVFMILGIPIQGGANRIYNVWVGDLLLTQLADLPAGRFLKDYVGSGNFESGGQITGATTTGVFVGDTVDQGWTSKGNIEFLNGNSTQKLVDPTTGVPSTAAGLYMTSTALLGDNAIFGDHDEPWNYGVGHLNPNVIPGYRGFLTAFHWSQRSDHAHWSLGLTPSMPAYSYEVGSYPSVGFFGIGPVGVDCNPVTVISDILTGGLGKLGLPLSYIDQASFIGAAVTLANENHGYSRAFDTRMTTADMLQEICLQIDGVLFEDAAAGTIKLKLIRADYDPATLPVISPDNCEELQNFAASGYTDVINRVVLTFTDRISNYKPGTATAFNQANAVGQDGQVNEMQVKCPGITSQVLANTVADRFLAAACRPLMKCRAVVNRSFLRLLPGSAVKLRWPEANISNIVFRVAGHSKGTLENGAIGLDLVQDYFYTHRGYPPVPTGFNLQQLITQS